MRTVNGMSCLKCAMTCAIKISTKFKEEEEQSEEDTLVDVAKVNFKEDHEEEVLLIFYVKSL